MRTKIALIVSVLVGALVFACSLPQLPVEPAVSSTTTAGGQSAGTSSPDAITVINDTARNVAVFAASDGTRLDVTAIDPASGLPVTCVKSVGFSVWSPPDGQESSPETVLVVGERNDGSPGAWQVEGNRHITLVEKDGAGKSGDLSPEDFETPHGLYRHFGWIYHVTAVSSDGRMVVGYAENPKGYDRGHLSIPAGTTVGIYWRIHHLGKAKHYHHLLSAPRVIGTWELPKRHGRFHFRLHHPFPSFVAQLKLFFLGSLNSYLVMTTAVDYDASQDAYVVTGVDQDGNDATATISADGKISIEAIVAPPATSYTDLYIDTFNPTGADPVTHSDVIELFDANGVLLSSNPWTQTGDGALDYDGTDSVLGGSNPNGLQTGWAYLHYPNSSLNDPPLPSGTVLYLRITGYGGDASGTGAWTGPYAVRVLAAASGSYPILTANPDDQGYEPDTPPISAGTPNPLAVITVGQPGNDTVSRGLTANDVDWIKIVLP